MTVARSLLLCLLSGAAAGSVTAAPAGEVARLLQARTAPAGVVFEVVSGDESELERALPRIRDHARRLRARFPDLAVAVVTHGAEQFSLLAEKAGRYGELHRLVTAFGEEDRIPVQVCGNHASYRGKAPADFPDDVEVVASAPSALSRYREAGYVVIVM